MCRMCEGVSREQVLDEARCHIIHHGWFLQGIVLEPDEDGDDWIYTVGLLENFGHPELVVTNVSYPDGGALLNRLGETIRGGLDLRSVPAVTLGVSLIREVHPVHFERDLVNTYVELQDRWPAAGDYLQVVPTYCKCHRPLVTDLSVEPTAAL